MLVFVIHPFYIWFSVFVLLSISFILLISIYIYLYKKKKRFFANTHLQEKIEGWISNFILDDTIKADTLVTIPVFLVQQFKNDSKKQFIINVLMESKRQLMGFAAAKIISIYEQLGFKEASLKKLNSKLWYEKTKGIQELYIMEQKDMLDNIYVLSNHNNQYVQREAQTAIIRFKGFAGLDFLNTLTQPISNWQQMNIMDQLKKFEFTPMPDLGNWITSQNETVVLFALKLALAYQQLQFCDSIVTHCLNHTNEMVRKQAVKTLTCMANENTIGLFIKQYKEESNFNKVNILQQLTIISSNMQQSFFCECLNDDDNFIKLEAAKALVRCSSEGMSILSQKAISQPQPYLSIYSHIKSDRYL